MHVAMLIGALTKGGAERVLVNLAADLTEKGHEVTMVTQYIDFSLVKIEQDKKENEYPLPDGVKRVISDITEEEITGSRIVNFGRRFGKLRMIWKTERPDVILSFIGKNNMMAILTSRFLHIPVAVSVRAEPALEYYNGWMRFMARHLFASADGVILQTRQCFSFFPEKVQKKAVILKNPINKAFFRQPYRGEREKTIVAVGRVDENKNHELLIRAFAGIAGEFPDYSLKIYGEGDQKERLQHLIHELGLEKQAFMMGATSDVAGVIERARLFVLPSNSEGAPNTLIEAMLLGLTVISTDCPCGGPAELIEDGKNGYLIPVGDTQKLQEKMQYLLNHLQIADEIGENAAKAAAIFKPEVVYGEWENYLYSLTKLGK